MGEASFKLTLGLILEGPGPNNILVGKSNSVVLTLCFSDTPAIVVIDYKCRLFVVYCEY